MGRAVRGSEDSVKAPAKVRRPASIVADRTGAVVACLVPANRRRRPEKPLSVARHDERRRRAPELLDAAVIERLAAAVIHGRDTWDSEPLARIVREMRTVLQRRAVIAYCTRRLDLVWDQSRQSFRWKYGIDRARLRSEKAERRQWHQRALRALCRAIAQGDVRAKQELVSALDERGRESLRRWLRPFCEIRVQGSDVRVELRGPVHSVALARAEAVAFYRYGGAGSAKERGRRERQRGRLRCGVCGGTAIAGEGVCVLHR